MATPAQLNLPQFLEMHYDGLTNHPKSTLKAYYSRPDVEDRILTVYTNALKETVPKAAIGGGIVGFGISQFLGLGVIGSIWVTIQGIGVGAGAGAMYETQRLVVDVRLDTSYLAWKDSIEKPIFDSFQTVLDTYEPFEDLRCRINLDFPKVAVRDRFNRLYDQEAIYKWIDQSGTHPVTRERMTSQDVTFDMGYARALQIAMDAAFGSDEFARINTDNPEEVIEGLKVALCTIVDNHNEIVQNRAQQVYNRAMAAGMPRIEARQLYLANIAAFVDMPEESKPKGLLAIVTAESCQELRKALQEETRLAVKAVASKVWNARQNPVPQEIAQAVHSPVIDVNEEGGDLLDEAIRVFIEGRPEVYDVENERI